MSTWLVESITTALEADGYEEGYRDGDCMLRTFGPITIAIYLVEHDGRPLVQPLVSVHMFHQCDNWQITESDAGSKVLLAEAIEQVREFLTNLTDVVIEVQRVRELLDRLWPTW